MGKSNSKTKPKPKQIDFMKQDYIIIDKLPWDDIDIQIDNHPIIERHSVYNFKISKEIKKIPHQCKIIEKINIFNSILIMINNVKGINDYFSNAKGKSIIEKCDKKYNSNCLSSILYNFNKYMWNDESKNNISENELYNKYNQYLSAFCKDNFKNENPNEFHDIGNTVTILEKIYMKINEELTSVSNKDDLYYIDVNHPVFSAYFKNFKATNKSKISNYFIGHYIIPSYCINCINIPNYIKAHRYQPFYYLIFNLDKINDHYQNQASKNNSLIKRNFDLMDCFDYFFNQEDKNIISKKNCTLCYNNSLLEKLYISILPNILTIILANNTNYNFVLKDTIEFDNKNNFEYNHLNTNEVKKYFLTSILCKFIDKNEFVCYCLNFYNGFWYRYSDGKVSQADKIRINEVPLIVMYKISKKENYIHRRKFDLNNVCINVTCSKGEVLTLLCNKKTDIKTVIEYISNITESNVQVLLINANKLDENQTLEDVMKVYQHLNFMVIIN